MASGDVVELSDDRARETTGAAFVCKIKLAEVEGIFVDFIGEEADGIVLIFDAKHDVDSTLLHVAENTGNRLELIDHVGVLLGSEERIIVFAQDGTCEIRELGDGWLIVRINLYE